MECKKFYAASFYPRESVIKWCDDLISSIDKMNFFGRKQLIKNKIHRMKAALRKVNKISYLRCYFMAGWTPDPVVNVDWLDIKKLNYNEITYSKHKRLFSEILRFESTYWEKIRKDVLSIKRVAVSSDCRIFLSDESIDILKNSFPKKKHIVNEYKRWVSCGWFRSEI